MRMWGGEQGCRGQLWLMHYSLLAVCTQREGDCGNFPESQCRTSFVSSFVRCTCIIKRSSCAIIKPLMCADSKRQAWKHFLVWLGQYESALTVPHSEYKLDIPSEEYRIISCHLLLPLHTNRFKMWLEPPYFSTSCYLWCLKSKDEVLVIPRHEMCRYLWNLCIFRWVTPEKHLLNGYVLIYQDKLTRKHTAHSHCEQNMYEIN